MTTLAGGLWPRQITLFFAFELLAHRAEGDNIILLRTDRGAVQVRISEIAGAASVKDKLPRLGTSITDFLRTVANEATKKTDALDAKAEKMQQECRK